MALRALQGLCELLIVYRLHGLLFIGYTGYTSILLHKLPKLQLYHGYCSTLVTLATLAIVLHWLHIYWATVCNLRGLYRLHGLHVGTCPLGAAGFAIRHDGLSLCDPDSLTSYNNMSTPFKLYKTTIRQE